MTRIFAAVAIVFTLYTQLGAQPANFPQPRPAEEIAKEKTDMVSEKVGLDEGQYSKAYKLYLAQTQDMLRSRPLHNFPQGMVSGGPPGISGGMRGGPPGGRMPGMGGPEGIPEEMRTTPPEGMTTSGMYEETEKSIKKREKKMKKILTPQQYDQWIVIEREMRYRTLMDTFRNLEP